MVPESGGATDLPVHHLVLEFRGPCSMAHFYSHTADAVKSKEAG